MVRLVDALLQTTGWYTGTKTKNMAVEERELWAGDLRGNEIGLLYSLPVLRLTRKQIGHEDPKADFAGLMATTKALYLMEASTGLTSDNRDEWRQAVITVTKKQAPGTRSLTKAEASRLAKTGWQTRNRGVTWTWLSDARERERKHLIRHWLASNTAREAHETLRDFADRMDGGVYNELIGISVATLTRICNTPRK